MSENFVCLNNLGMLKEMVSGKKMVSEKITLWKKKSNKIGHLKALVFWKGMVLEKHFMSQNMGVCEIWMSKNVVS